MRIRAAVRKSKQNLEIWSKFSRQSKKFMKRSVKSSHACLVIAFILICYFYSEVYLPTQTFLSRSEQLQNRQQNNSSKTIFSKRFDTEFHGYIEYPISTLPNPGHDDKGCIRYTGIPKNSFYVCLKNEYDLRMKENVHFEPYISNTLSAYFSKYPQACLMEVSNGLSVHALQVAHSKKRVIALKMNLAEAKKFAKGGQLNHNEDYIRLFVSNNSRTSTFPLNHMEKETTCKRILLRVDTGGIPACTVFDNSSQFLYSNRFKIDMVILRIATFPPQGNPCLTRVNDMLAKVGFVVGHPLTLKNMQQKVFGNMELWDGITKHVAYVRNDVSYYRN